MGHTLTCRFLKVKKYRLVFRIRESAAHSQKDGRKGLDGDFEVTR